MLVFTWFAVTAIVCRRVLAVRVKRDARLKRIAYTVRNRKKIDYRSLWRALLLFVPHIVRVKRTSCAADEPRD